MKLQPGHLTSRSTIISGHRPLLASRSEGMKVTAGVGGIESMRLDRTLEGLGKAAREARKVLWADPQPMPPWEWILKFNT